MIQLKIFLLTFSIFGLGAIIYMLDVKKRNIIISSLLSLLLFLLIFIFFWSDSDSFNKIKDYLGFSKNTQNNSSDNDLFSYDHELSYLENLEKWKKSAIFKPGIAYSNYYIIDTLLEKNDKKIYSDKNEQVFNHNKALSSFKNNDDCYCLYFKCDKGFFTNDYYFSQNEMKINKNSLDQNLLIGTQNLFKNDIGYVSYVYFTSYFHIIEPPQDSSISNN